MIKKITRKVMKEIEETVSSVGICDICGKEFTSTRQRGSHYWNLHKIKYSEYVNQNSAINNVKAVKVLLSITWLLFLYKMP